MKTVYCRYFPDRDMYMTEWGEYVTQQQVENDWEVVNKVELKVIDCLKYVREDEMWDAICSAYRVKTREEAMKKKGEGFRFPEYICRVIDSFHHEAFMMAIHQDKEELVLNTNVSGEPEGQDFTPVSDAEMEVEEKEDLLEAYKRAMRGVG